MIKQYFLLVSRHSAPRVYKRYPGANEDERVYRLAVDIPDAPRAAPYWEGRAIELQAPEAAAPPTAEAAPTGTAGGKGEGVGR